ncbi:hypothetical protein SCLCIDRAFT_481534 [Scleroderma citrinum Foug A]|uniref:Uncharacterized protein n=1 Tax=Scleroderma citrinum Foug A TaxID=1036808 RepID=A0A0C2YT42_9AGAM|nr:hypothetical protein SCLCIDRAFT_481534 [Scleroderma citrinum Foug A]
MTGVSSSLLLNCIAIPNGTTWHLNKVILMTKNRRLGEVPASAGMNLAWIDSGSVCFCQSTLDPDHGVTLHPVKDTSERYKATPYTPLGSHTPSSGLESMSTV